MDAPQGMPKPSTPGTGGRTRQASRKAVYRPPRRCRRPGKGGSSTAPVFGLEMEPRPIQSKAGSAQLRPSTAGGGIAEAPPQSIGKGSETPRRRSCRAPFLL